MSAVAAACTAFGPDWEIQEVYFFKKTYARACGWEGASSGPIRSPEAAGFGRWAHGVVGIALEPVRECQIRPQIAIMMTTALTTVILLTYNDHHPATSSKNQHTAIFFYQHWHSCLK